MTYTQNRSKKLLKNKNKCTIFLFLFRQLSLSLSLLQFPISAMPLPQIHSHKFFFFYFSNAIAINPIPQFFFPLFRQCHCHKSIALFFFFLRNDMCTPFLQQILNGRLLLVVIVGFKK